MVFSSVIFIFAFLPLFLASYYVTPVRYRSYVILLLSYGFYAWWRIDFAFLMFFTTLVNYIAVAQLFKSDNARYRLSILVGMVVSNLALLFYYKYFNFFADSMAFVFNGGQTYAWGLPHVILPIGISFYIFHNLSYLVDVYRRDLTPSRSFVDFSAFIAFFPHQIAGPVLRFADLKEQFYERAHNPAKFNYGAVRFMTGLAKKVLIADPAAVIADAAFAIPNPTASEAWLGAIAYSIQLYFDFSGYSSMAIGLAMMVGFYFVENFDAPYTSVNITDFWRRWHISLSSWLRDYLYISLGGSRITISRTYVNLAATMVLGGLWHGANMTFIVWGAWHGLWLIIERIFNVKANAPFRFANWLLTTLIFVIGWVFFRSETMGQAMDMLSGMFGLHGFALRSDYAWQFSSFSLLVLLIGIAIALGERKLRRLFHLMSTHQLVKAGEIDNPPVTSTTAIAATAFGALAILKLVADSDTPFLYFQF
ncbi:D-alanyl-lipoteichoic acid biosynthesis protein DltB [Roseibium album]|nr:D-alanyl-lipoteichoic acid biosynthesis protein DltB [Roseibium album]